MYYFPYFSSFFFFLRLLNIPFNQSPSDGRLHNSSFLLCPTKLPASSDRAQVTSHTCTSTSVTVNTCEAGSEVHALATLRDATAALHGLASSPTPSTSTCSLTATRQWAQHARLPQERENSTLLQFNLLHLIRSEEGVSLRLYFLVSILCMFHTFLFHFFIHFLINL